MNVECSVVKEFSLETEQGTLAFRCWEPEIQSNAAPIILFHDSLGAISLWRQFPDLLAQQTGRTVIAYDRLGFGRSAVRTDKLPADFVGQEPQTIIPLLNEQLDISKFVALGHSVGGAMAIETAAQFPDQCVGLVTIAAQTFAEDVTLNGIRDAKKMFADPDQLKRLEKYHGERAKWVVDAWIETWLSDEFADWTLKDTLPKVTCPALVIHGSDDEYGSTIHPRIIAQNVSGSASVEVLEGNRHMPHRENEAHVITLVKDFLHSID
ncbi:MAG: alpha/beta hydrolase [Methylocystaceae bacterium]|nr:alpha/beta hydrolase [Methylocystaceae bacterium]